MGYLDNTTVTVDAILTNKGRQILAQGGQLNITKFALSDDEVDYRLWNPAHSLGSNYYGAVIENMPILEASPDETQMLRYKLVTLPRTAVGIPQISVTVSSVNFTRLADVAPVRVTTSNFDGGNNTLGYTAILSDDTVASLEVAPDAVLATSAPIASVTGRAAAPSETQAASAQATFSSFVDDEVGSITSAGNTITRTSSGGFILRPKAVIGTKSALLTLIANETGGFKTIVVTTTNTIDEGTVDVINNEQA
jgi:hypothetical protein